MIILTRGHVVIVVPRELSLKVYLINAHEIGFLENCYFLNLNLNSKIFLQSKSKLEKKSLLGCVKIPEN
jgi:hypothetical protein